MYKFLDVFRTLKLPDDIRVYMGECGGHEGFEDLH